MIYDSLPLGKKKKPNVIRLEKKQDASDIYYIKEAIIGATDLPPEFEPPVRIRKIRATPESPYDMYRVTIFARWHHGRTSEHRGQKVVLKPGLGVWRTWVVTKVSNTEYLFEPPLNESS